jgi:SAM-dependent methyltransferase
MSTTLTIPTDPYERLAPVYHLLTSGYEYEVWLGNLLKVVEGADIRVSTVLDVACGTGSSALPMVKRGYAVTGTDRSPAMLAIASAHLGSETSLVIADMRELPRLGQFDLVMCLDDSLNHLLTPAEFEAALRGMTANLVPGGGLLFDLNTLPTLRAAFSRDWIVEDDETLLLWHGTGPPTLERGGLTNAELSVLRLEEDGRFDRERVVVEERHYPLDEVRRLLTRCGLDLAAVHGQQRGGHLAPLVGEDSHHKLVFLAKRPVSDLEGR